MPWVSKARAADKLRLRLDFTASGLHAPFYLGLQRGWFERAGIDLSMEDGNGSSATVQLVCAGLFDLGLHSLAPLAIARAKGVPVISVAGFVRKGELGFLVPAESGWKTPKDLIGKKVVYGVASQEGPFVRYFLRQNGVGDNEVELVNVDGPSRYAVYFTKQADALLTTVPGVMPIAAVRRPSVPIILADFGLNIPGLGMSARTDLLASKKAAIRRFHRRHDVRTDPPVQTILLHRCNAGNADRHAKRDRLGADAQIDGRGKGHSSWFQAIHLFHQSLHR
jgi:NitT/TauT family transport system substrate-binding protein